MPVQQETKPVGDSVPKVNNEIAVGSDLEFQRKWWTFERATWIVLALFVLLTFLGCFGRGPLSKAHLTTQDGALDIEYERICRMGAASIMRVHFGPAAVQTQSQNQKQVQLWISDNLVKALMPQRVIPIPETTAVSQGGLLYTFPVTSEPLDIEFQLMPGQIGKTAAKVMAPGFQPASVDFFVLP